MPQRFRVLVLKYPTQRLTELRSRELDELKHLSKALNSEVQRDETVTQMGVTVVGSSLVYSILVETKASSFSYFTKDQKRG